MEKMRHPELTRGHFHEYEIFLTDRSKSLPFFKKSFSFDEFCLNGVNPELGKYIDLLVSGAEDKIAVLKFNRSALRIKWFKENYPQALNIYLVRSPRHQWQSYVSMKQDKGLDVFLVLDLLVSGLNKRSDVFRKLAEKIYLVEHHSENYDDEETGYRFLIDAYDDEEKYYIFYYIWLRSIISGALHGDIILSIDLIGSDESYRKNFERFLGKQNIPVVDFSDARINRYDHFQVDFPKMEKIENEVIRDCFGEMATEEIDKFFSRLPGELNFLISRENISNAIADGKDSRLYDRCESSSGKAEKMIGTLLSRAVRQKNEFQVTLEAINKEIKARDRIICEKLMLIESQRQENENKKDEIIIKERLLDEKNQEIVRLNQKLFQDEEKIREKDRIIDQKQKEIEQKERQLFFKTQEFDRIRGSLNFKTGQIVLSPFRIIKKMLSKATGVP